MCLYSSRRLNAVFVMLLLRSVLAWETNIAASLNSSFYQILAHCASSDKTWQIYYITISSQFEFSETRNYFQFKGFGPDHLPTYIFPFFKKNRMGIYYDLFYVLTSLILMDNA